MIPDGGAAVEACLTPDGQYVLSGCADRTIRAWSVADGEVVAEWKGHAGVPTCIKARAGLCGGGGVGWGVSRAGCRAKPWSPRCAGKALPLGTFPGAITRVPVAQCMGCTRSCHRPTQDLLRSAALQWSPRKMLVASACQALALWIPA